MSHSVHEMREKRKKRLERERAGRRAYSWVYALREENASGHKTKGQKQLSCQRMKREVAK